ncbi:MAG: hypothetical protein N2690_07790 [Rhodocyclaceae bacterium]|nr:hypothetical protein [Rhodocyclaceae bacterium]
MADKSSGRLSRFLSFVSLLCLIAAIVYLLLASGPCDRIRRFVYVFNDVPAMMVLTVLRPWAQDGNIYWRASDYFRVQRIELANFLVRQIHGQANYAVMCAVRERGENR